MTTSAESRRVQTGLDNLRECGFSLLKGARIGVLANAAAVDSNLDHLVDLLVKSNAGTVVKIFAPEHGFRGALQDMESVGHMTDPQTGITVVSLYGATESSLKPRPEDFQDIDVLVADLPDIGSRYYTFAQTLSFAMEVAGPAGVKVVVLDRPNPIAGDVVEGAPLQAKCRSFCGRTPVANRHSLTLGELAEVYRAGFGDGADALAPIPCDLTIVPVTGWKRSMYWDETALPWVLPSPNMPTLDTAIVYPGGCLFEATNLSEGRGTTRPFELVGAPFIDGFKWIEETHRLDPGLRGAVLRPVVFLPKFHKWAAKECGGVQIHVTDRKAFRSMRWGLALVAAAKSLYPREFAWRTDTYEFVDSVPAIDLLYGSSTYRETVDRGEPLSEIFAEMNSYESAYQTAVQKFFRY